MEEKINGTTKTCAADTWEARDVAHIWHPAAQMKDYEELPPIVVERFDSMLFILSILW